MNRRRNAMVVRPLLLACFVPAAAAAQSGAQTPPSTAPMAPISNVWVVAGGAWATLRGDCQTCEEEAPYRQTGSVLANLGYRVNGRMDVGAEVFWVPARTASGNVRVTHIDAVAQFRPWASSGFFVKGGAGMAFVRNWVDALGSDSINSKALSVAIGAGWAFRPAERVGLQVFGAQHVAALGDFQTADAEIQDVVANFWSLGAAIVIR